MQPDNNSSAMKTGYYGGLSGSNPGGQNPQSLGQVIGQIANDWSGASANNKFNAIESYNAWLRSEASAQANRDWQTWMSNTSYQRAVADMQAAGLNPASVGGQGNLSPASTPGGSAASAHGASASGSRSSLGSIIGQIASVALGKTLMAKFTNAGMAAADNHQLVAAKIKSLAANEIASARQAELYKENLDIQRERNRQLAESSKRGNDIREKQVSSQGELNKARVADIYHKHHWWSDSSDFD